jgi:hypothetical protein
LGQFGAQAWELRPVKPALYKRVQVIRIQSVDTLRRRARFEDLFTLDYNTDLDSSLKGSEDNKSKWGWNLFVEEYLQTRQSHRDLVGAGGLGFRLRVRVQVKGSG